MLTETSLDVFCSYVLRVFVSFCIPNPSTDMLMVKKKTFSNFKLQSNPCVYNACMADKIEMIVYESTTEGGTTSAALKSTTNQKKNTIIKPI